MRKIIGASFLAALTLTMLLPAARQVNAATVNQSVLHQGSNPTPPGGGGGHFQGSNPTPPGGGGGHFQGSNPTPPGGGGGH